MATTWAVFIFLGAAAIYMGPTSATSLHMNTTFTVTNISTKPDFNQTTYAHSPIEYETLQLSLSTEEEIPLALETDDLENAERINPGQTGKTTKESLQQYQLVKKSDLKDDSSDKEEKSSVERNKKDQDSNSREDEYEELPVPMAQTAVGYTRSDGTYIVNDEDGVGCIMAYFKSKATIYYPDTKGDYKNIRVSPVDDAKVSGMCDRVGQVSQMDVSWSSYVLSLRFGLDDLSDSWFVSRFSLTYNLTDPDFTDAAPGGGEVTVASKDDQKYWRTNNEKSFRCLLLHDVILTDKLNNTATLHFDEVRVQAFCKEDTFREPKHCIHRVHRDELVPVTVGAALAGSTLLTVIGYAIFRYFKVKKVQYDTME
ncbi:lysosome-associated membrane glycoprotein 1-like [Cherax quadricarinatus]